MSARRERVSAITFDFGQTLCELDAAMLARRLSERGIAVGAAQIQASMHEAWRAYDDAITLGPRAAPDSGTLGPRAAPDPGTLGPRAAPNPSTLGPRAAALVAPGSGGGHPWKVLMARLLELSGVRDEARGAAVDWLWDEQPRANLWRRPIPDMIALCRDLHGEGVPLGIVSNSEGRLAELVEELGLTGLFAVVADSGKLGIEKPDPAIFGFALDRMGAAPEAAVHIGDAWGADIEGARAAGLRAIWFQGRGTRDLPPGILRADDATSVRAALRELGLP